jgi:hypothetical protein
MAPNVAEDSHHDFVFRSWCTNFCRRLSLIIHYLCNYSSYLEADASIRKLMTKHAMVRCGPFNREMQKIVREPRKDHLEDLGLAGRVTDIKEMCKFVDWIDRLKIGLGSTLLWTGQ